MRNVMSGQSSNDDIYFFIMRHGEAEAPRLDDKGRQLTTVGKAQTADASNWLIKHYCPDHKVDFALVSPYQRTRQTFDLFSNFVSSNKTEISEDITPNGNADDVHHYLFAKAHRSLNMTTPMKRVLVVSHMPLVSYLVDSLCGSFTTCLFATASIAVIKYNLTEQKGILETHYQG